MSIPLHPLSGPMTDPAARDQRTAQILADICPLAPAWERDLILAYRSGAFETCPYHVLWGPPGTGKSSLLRTLLGADRVGKVIMSPDAPKESLLGGWVLRSGETEWMNGPGPSAFVDPTGALRGLCIDEGDFMSPDVQPALYELLDDPSHASLSLDNGESVRLDPGLVIFMTTNAEPSALPPAIQDRHHTIVHANEPTSGLLSAIGDDRWRAYIQNVYRRGWTDGSPTCRDVLTVLRLTPYIGETRAAEQVFNRPGVIPAHEVLTQVATFNAR